MPKVLESGLTNEHLALKLVPLWSAFKVQPFSFWMVCGYLVFEYIRPHAIIPALDILPWAQCFIIFSLIGLLSEKQSKWVSSPVNFWMIAFFVVILLSSYAAYEPSIAQENLANFYTWLIIYFVIINSVRTERQLFLFLLIFIVASAKLSFFGARVWLFRGFAFTTWGVMGPPGFFQNSGELAIQMSIFFGISASFYLIVRERIGRVKRLIVLSLPITAAMTIIATSSRGAQIALCVQILFLLRRKISFKTTLITVLATVLILSITPEEQKDRFRSIGQDDTSKQRVLYWKHGVDMLKENPVLGVGFFNFPKYYQDFFPEDLLGLRKIYGAELPHNIFIQVAAELGYFGLLVYLILINYGFLLSRRIQKKTIVEGDVSDWRGKMSQGLTLSLIGFLIAGQFVSVVYYPFLWIHLAIVCALRATFAKA